MHSQRGSIDFIAYDREGRVLLLAEAKSRRGTSRSWAAQLRQNILAHGMLPSSKYFLIATPERMYLWKQQSNSTAMPPEVTLDAEKLLQPYFRKLNQEPLGIAPEAFGHLVMTWLTDMAQRGIRDSGERDSADETSAAWLSELSGSLKEARIEMNPPQ